VLLKSCTLSKMSLNRNNYPIKSKSEIRDMVIYNTNTIHNFSKNRQTYVGFKVLRVVTMMITIFLDVTPCSLVHYYQFHEDPSFTWAWNWFVSWVILIQASPSYPLSKRSVLSLLSIFWEIKIGLQNHFAVCVSVHPPISWKLEQWSQKRWPL
jgi:hypothetical protein